MLESTTLAIDLPVQNGTVTNGLSVQEYVDRFNGRIRDEAKAIVERAEVLVEAERKLPNSKFIQFCKAIDVEYKKSEYKKLRTIGKNVWRFNGRFDERPNNWTTIYRLAQMNEDKFDEFIEEDRLRPNLKAREIDEFLQKPPKRRKQREVYVSFKVADPETKLTIITALKECVAEFDGKALIVESDPGAVIPSTTPTETTD